MVSITHWFTVLKQKAEARQQAWDNALSAQEVEAACRREGHRWRDRIWTPLWTLHTFLLQVLHPDCSCREAVALALAERVAAGDKRTVSADPSAYAGARKRLPEGVIRQTVGIIGQGLREAVHGRHTLFGRRIWMVDGSGCSMPDTAELQKAFGQPGGQKKGCGFPVAKIVALFCWASGAVVDVAIGSWRTSELPLWRTLWGWLKEGEIVLADRFYCNFADIVGLLRRGCDSVFRLHQRRKVDFREGRRLGKDDRLVTWERPKRHNRRRGMSVAEWRKLPLTLTVRLIRANLHVRGFRCRKLLIATTLLDPVAYPAEQIIALYRDRWTVELRLRDIKATLGMDVLRGKTPEVVRKEIYMHLLAYNLVRALMWQAAERHGRGLHRLSFAGAVDRMNAFGPYLQLYQGTDRAVAIYELLLSWIATDKLPYRPDRVEPRAVKRRPKEYDLLNRPRQELRKVLMR